MQARRIEAEKKRRSGEGKIDKGEASGSNNKRSKRVKRKSVAQLIIEQKELAEIRAEKEKEMWLKQKEEVEATYLMGNLWGAHNEEREDQTKRMISKLLHERRDPKKYVL